MPDVDRRDRKAMLGQESFGLPDFGGAWVTGVQHEDRRRAGSPGELHGGADRCEVEDRRAAWDDEEVCGPRN
jgi:hypothetical protein